MENLKKIWPEWRIIEKVGEGSFGKVYKCVRDDYGITLYSAVKVITIPQNESEINNLRLEGMSESETRTYFEGIVNDFANEIKMMVLLRNAPNIVPVENYAIVEHEGKIGWSIYIRMEYLTPFGDYVFKNKIDEADVKKFGLDMCSALEVCAKKDIIHRDIKPDNIFIDEYGNYRLGDFGVARQLENTVGSMSKKGTYSYMAPEVYRGGKYDNRADIYSLGMVMYKLLNNNRDPFLDPHKPNLLFGDRQHALERRMNGERFSAPCNASAKMAEIILKAVEFRPEDRFANVEEFKNALNALNAPVTADEPTVAARDFEEKTVAARDVDLTVAAPVQADYNEATVVMADEPTAIDNSNDLTVVADFNPDATDAFDDDPDATLIADENYEEQSVAADKKLKPHEKKKKYTIIIAVAAVLLVLVFWVAGYAAVQLYNYSRAEKALASGDKEQAAMIFGNIVNFSDSRERSFELWDEIAVRETVAAGSNHTVALKADGTAVAVGYDNDGQCDVDGWTDIVAVAAGSEHTVGLKADGTVVTAGDNGWKQCDVDGWSDIVAVAAGDWHTVGLKADGTVVAVGAVGAKDYGQCDVDGWNGIIAVSAGESYTVGLKVDGTVVAVGTNASGQCNVDGWTDIVAISAGKHYTTIGLKSDGTVVAAGNNDNGQCDVDRWTDIVAVSAGCYYTVGLKSDGTVVAVGDNYYGQCDVDDWKDIVAVSAGNWHTVGLKSDGTVVAVGWNDDGQCDVDSWKNIKIPK